MCVTGLCWLAQSFMEVNYKISSSEWSGTGMCVILECQRWHNSWKVHLQKILWLDEAKLGLLNHSATVCGQHLQSCPEVMELAPQAVHYSWQLHSLAPRWGGLSAPQERESWGKGFYGRRCSKVVGFWVCARLGASSVFLHEGWWKLSVILVWGKRFWRSYSCFKHPLGWPRPPLWKILLGSEGTFLSSFQLNRFPITTPPPCTPCKKGQVPSASCFSFLPSGMEIAYKSAWTYSSVPGNFWRKEGRGNCTWKHSQKVNKEAEFVPLG